jgi:hypothetical protein
MSFSELGERERTPVADDKSEAREFSDLHTDSPGMPVARR